MKRIILFLSLIMCVLFSIHLINKTRSLTNHQTNKKNTSTLKQEAKIKIGSKEINVEIADSLYEKEKGLSGKDFILDNEGMIFVFPQKTYPFFWMKGMKFPLDIIWISNNKIVQIDENIPSPNKIQKESDLPLYRPSEAVDYVLEVNAGFSKKYSIKKGDTVEIKF